MLYPGKCDERMQPALLLHPIAVHTGSGDEDGRLVLAHGRLVAVLVRLGDASHAGIIGFWFLEAGFGPCARAQGCMFRNLDIAEDWIQGQLGR